MVLLGMIGMQQIHGSYVVRVSQKDDGKIIENCDGLISNDPKVTLLVRVADCLPISLVDKKTHSFGLIHAGWRGLDKGIIKKAIDLMQKELRIKNSDLKISIGPHICQKHYEVGRDVFSKFTKYPEALLQKNNKLFLDLAKIAELQLINNGVKKENIKISKTCTFEGPSLPSFRRSKTSERILVKLNI
jgi:YfiH family protein